MAKQTGKLRFGVYLPHWIFRDEAPPTARFLKDFCRRVEDLGFDSIWVNDKLLEVYPSYRVTPMDQFTSLALVATSTERVRFGSGVTILPLRNPVPTAKAFASLDVLSEGRLICGVGVGWDDMEFKACQVPKSERGRRMDESLAILTGLWSNDTFSYAGKIFSVPEIRLIPRPVQLPHPPLWFSGGIFPAAKTTAHITQTKGYAPERSLQRAANIGHGIITSYRAAPGLDMSFLKASWDVVLAEARRIGRDPSTICFAHQDHMYIDADGNRDRLRTVLGRFSHNTYEEAAHLYMMGHPDELIPRFQARIDAGVEELLFALIQPDPQQLDLFMNKIRPHLRPRGTA